MVSPAQTLIGIRLVNSLRRFFYEAHTHKVRARKGQREREHACNLTGAPNKHAAAAALKIIHGAERNYIYTARRFSTNFNACESLALWSRVKMHENETDTRARVVDA